MSSRCFFVAVPGGVMTMGEIHVVPPANGGPDATGAPDCPTS